MIRLSPAGGGFSFFIQRADVQMQNMHKFCIYAVGKFLICMF